MLISGGGGCNGDVAKVGGGGNGIHGYAVERVVNVFGRSAGGPLGGRDGGSGDNYRSSDGSGGGNGVSNGGSNGGGNGSSNGGAGNVFTRTKKK